MIDFDKQSTINAELAETTECVKALFAFFG
jgi:hypothetical protein